MAGIKPDDDKTAKFSDVARPLSALAAGFRFVVDINDTKRFFEMSDAIEGRQHERNYQRYLRTDIGARLDAEGFDLPAYLINHELLKQYPEGSLAAAYLKFLSSENLDLNFLMSAEQTAGATTLYLNSSRRRYFSAGIANHDLLHVLTGYGRDPLGEALLLTFSAEQFKLRSVGGLARAIALREWIANRTFPVFKLLEEARTMARETTWIAEVDWQEMIPMRTSAVREAIGMKRPPLYTSLKESQATVVPVSEPLSAPTIETRDAA